MVFLDLQRDEYTLVNGNAAESIRGLIFQGESQLHPKQRDDALRELLEGGLLTAERCGGKTIRPTRVAVPLHVLVDPYDEPSVRVGIRHAVVFTTACTRALVHLKRMALKDIVAAIARRKSKLAANSPLDIQRLRELTAIFNVLRPFFPRDYLCLYDSLALLEFLAYYGLFPTWVFGVSLEPWAAHCWLQASEYVINEGVEEAANFTAVMAI